MQNIGESLSKGLNVISSDKHIVTQFFGTDKENDTPPKLKDVPDKKVKKQAIVSQKQKPTEINCDQGNIKMTKKTKEKYLKSSETESLSLDSNVPSTSAAAVVAKNGKAKKKSQNLVNKKFQKLQINDENPLNDNAKDVNELSDEKLKDKNTDSTNISQNLPDINCDISKLSLSNKDSHEDLNLFDSNKSSTSNAAALELQKINEKPQNSDTSAILMKEHFQEIEILKKQLKQLDKRMREYENNPSESDSDSESNDSEEDSSASSDNSNSDSVS